MVDTPPAIRSSSSKLRNELHSSTQVCTAEVTYTTTTEVLYTGIPTEQSKHLLGSTWQANAQTRLHCALHTHDCTNTAQRLADPGMMRLG